MSNDLAHYTTNPCIDCGAPTDPRWLGRCRACEPSLHRCEECGEQAMGKRNLGGIACWRCARCAEAAACQAVVDVALARIEALRAGLAKRRRASRAEQKQERVFEAVPLQLEMEW
jgi:hypothetical protein